MIGIYSLIIIRFIHSIWSLLDSHDSDVIHQMAKIYFRHLISIIMCSADVLILNIASPNLSQTLRNDLNFQKEKSALGEKLWQRAY